jgi:hypothetical protein
MKDKTIVAIMAAVEAYMQEEARAAFKNTTIGKTKE